MDLLDKTEVPTVPDCYGLSVAYCCVLDLVESVASIVDSCSVDPENNEMSSLRVQLVASSWTGTLAGLTALVDAWYV